MKTIMIVYDRSISKTSLVTMSDDLRNRLGWAVYLIATAAIDVPDIRMWDMGTLTPIELDEVKRLVETVR